MTQREMTKDFFDHLAGSWDNMQEKKSKKIKTILNVTGLKPGDRILDVATGTGVLIPVLRKYHPSFIRAIDLSPKMIEVASSKPENADVFFSAQDFYTFNESGYNYLICYQGYPHFDDKAAFCQKVSQCLIPGGRFVIAHSDGRARINSRHTGKNVVRISDPLKKAKKEAKLFKEDFTVDILVDTDEYFIISGLKK